MPNLKLVEILVIIKERVDEMEEEGEAMGGEKNNRGKKTSRKPSAIILLRMRVGKPHLRTK